MFLDIISFFVSKVRQSLAAHACKAKVLGPAHVYCGPGDISLELPRVFLLEIISYICQVAFVAATAHLFRESVHSIIIYTYGNFSTSEPINRTRFFSER